MEMWDGSYSPEPATDIGDDPPWVPGREYLKMSVNERAVYEKKLFGGYLSSTTIITHKIYVFNGKRYGSLLAADSARVYAARKTRDRKAFYEDEIKIEIVGCKEISKGSKDGKELLSYVITTSKYKALESRTYQTIDEIADAMDQEDAQAQLLQNTKTWQSVASTPTGTVYSQNIPTVKPTPTLFYEEVLGKVKELIQYTEDYKMYDSIFDGSRIQMKHVNEVLDIYNKIITPSKRDNDILMEALSHMQQHLEMIISSFKEKQSDDLEIYRNFLGMKFNLRGLFS